MATVPNKPAGSAQQEWQVVYNVTVSDTSDCTTVDESAYSTLRRHAGPLREPAISLLQQAARKVLQRGCVCSLKPHASGGDRDARAADTHGNAASSPAESHDAAAAVLPTSGGGGQTALQPSDWELI